MKLLFELKATFCNSWPKLKIYVNDNLLFNDFIVEHRLISLVVPNSETFTVVIEGIEKQFGENNVWDTKLDGEEIIEDKTLKILDVQIDDISMGSMWLQNLSNNGTFYKNEKLFFTITTPILNWIIEEKFIRNQSSAGTYSGGDKFSYDKVLNTINYIKNKYFNDQNINL